MTTSLAAYMAGIGSSSSIAALVAKTGDTMTGALNNAPAVPMASAATFNIGAAGSNRINVVGTIAITGFDVIAAGAVRTLIFSAVLTITHNAGSLILPTGANITTEVGDVAEFESLGGGSWRCTDYQRASGNPIMPLKTIGGQSLAGFGNIVVGGFTVVQALTTTQAVAVSNDYFTHASTTTFTAPASASPGDRWGVTITNGKLDNSVNWNGLKHQGITDATMVLDAVRSWSFKYVDATFGWKVD